MQKLLSIVLMFLAVGMSAQTALYNSGNLRIHENGTLGFHTDLINEAPFDTNLGLAGFYGTDALRVSGSVVPLFHDVEIMVENGLNLNLGIDNANNTNFILGDINTPKNLNDIYYNFLDSDGFYIGEGDLTKVNGFAAIANQQNFVFPVGDGTFLRAVTLSSERTTLFAKCAYFFEDPSAPLSLNGSYDTNELGRELERVNAVEFWKLESDVAATINLSWNTRSNMGILTDDTNTIVLAGWSKTNIRWENLGASSVVGDLEEGFLTSLPFVPNDYDIIGLGVSKIPFEPLAKEVLSLDNYFVSPNGDGINDFLFIPELEESPNNLVRIYDRYGLKVFEKPNYRDEFSGIPNVDNLVVQKDQGLPAGVYFYTVFMKDLNLNYQGFLYLTNK
ncbi:gliding motility-associated C-terminal domain-containing protein [Maribacter chungangensis]|uniref:Gliding motility-associated C-terminal domain-containing protein n=1 Tax=Maribacter chungangensis TaxID=1069117 RepID=A0ABW3B8I6_9FLAO